MTIFTKKILAKLVLFLALASLLQGCVFIQQVRESKKSKSNPITVTDTLTDEGLASKEDSMKKKQSASAKEISQPTIADNRDFIWYHPNPWWKIKTQPFPVSADSFQYRMMRPQYGFPKYLNQDMTSGADTWNLWLQANKMYDIPEFAGHAWQMLFFKFKDTLLAHPEYLAEVNGRRLGYGNTNKLCVTNDKVQQLYLSNLEDIIKNKPERRFLGVEPTDGYGFCECSECNKLGSISNQVFYFANQIARKGKNRFPNQLFNLYAYNLHSDTPSFKLEENIVVAVIPGGFQTLYPLNSMLTNWAKHHKNLYWRDYFGIPQWTSDLPRIDVEEFLTRTDIAKREGYKALVMESGMNLNAALLYVLFNAKWMNDSLTWEGIFEKFIHDCFPESKVPMKRLFTRWHHSWLGKEEYPATLFDLNEAWALANHGDERRRLADITAYSRMIHLLYAWLDNREDESKLEAFVQYILRLGSRNLVHPRALLTAYNRHFKDEGLKKKYNPEILKNYSYQYLSDEEVIRNFRSDLTGLKPLKNEFNPLWMKDIKKLKFEKAYFSREFSAPIKARSFMHVYTDSTLAIHTVFNPKNVEDSALITVNNHDNTFHLARIMRNGDNWSVPIKGKDAYAIHVHRANSVTIRLSGRFIPIMSEPPSKPVEGLAIYSYQNGWKRLNPGEKIIHSNPYYFLFRE